MTNGVTVVNGSGSNNSKQLLPKICGQKSSRVEASISKVTNWSKLGSSLTSEDQWKEHFLKAAESGDLTKIVSLFIIYFLLLQSKFSVILYLTPNQQQQRAITK